MGKRSKKSCNRASSIERVQQQQGVVVEQNQVDRQSRLPNPESSPWLMFCHRKNQKTLALYSVPESQTYTRSTRELRKNGEFKYWPSPQGWLFMQSQSSEDCFLLNPVSLERVVLPPLKLDFHGSLKKFVISASPTNSICSILFLVSNEPYLLFCRPSDHNGWIEYNPRLNIDDDEDGIWDIVACNGKFYGLISNCRLILIDPNSTSHLEMRSFAPPRPPMTDIWRVDPYLLESCGEVLLIEKYYFYNSRIVSCMIVCKMDLDKKVWVEMVTSSDGINDRVFFIDNKCSGSCSASQKNIKGNRIYFNQDGDPRLYAYDLDDQTISTELPCPNLQSPWSPPIWLMPPI